MDIPSKTTMHRAVIRDHISSSPAEHRIMLLQVSKIHLSAMPASIPEFPDISLPRLHHRVFIRNTFKHRAIRAVFPEPVLPRHPVLSAARAVIPLPGAITAGVPDISRDILRLKTRALHIPDIRPEIPRMECPETAEALFLKHPTVPDIQVPDMNLL